MRCFKIIDKILSSTIHFAIKSWIKGEISGEQLYPVIETAFIEVGGDIGDYIARTCLGTDWSDTGRSAGRWLAKTVMELIFKYMFGRPKDEALSYAYGFLGVEKTASTEETNTAYQMLAGKYNPKRSSGSEVKFFILKFAMVVIVEARAEDAA